MRICIHKSTNHILEMQSGGELPDVTMEIAEESLRRDSEEISEDKIVDRYRYLLDEKARMEGLRLNTLKQNALSIGYIEADIEVKWVTEAEYEAWRKLDDTCTWNGTGWVYNLAEGKAAKLTQVREAAQMVILAKYPLWFQTNVATGIYSEAIGATMKAGIAAVITESNRCEDLVDAATTEEEINAVTPNWPTL